MDRYINADALMKKLNEDPIGQTIVQRYNIDGFIEAFPTADVVEVVRCKDCKHYRDLFPYNTCDVFDAKATDAEDYCSYGERKETEDE